MKILITGASSGIGKSMATYLSSKDNELILVSSNEDKLSKVSNELINSKYYVYDLTIDSEVDNLCEIIKREKPDFVINNAGFGAFGYYDEISIDREIDMIKVNVIALQKITKSVLSYMNKGYILNVCSIAGFMCGGPFLNTYYATKNYVKSYSLGLYKELKNKNKDIHISILCPGPVNTNFNKVALGQFSMKGKSSQFVAKYAIDKCLSNKLIILPGFDVKLGYFFSKFVPTKLLLSILYKIQHRKLS